MSKRKSATGVSKKFRTIDKDYEEEILGVYAELTETEEDLYLKSLSKVFLMLKIPKCFTKDILNAVEYYYELQGSIVKFSNSKSDIVIQMIVLFTITSVVNSDEDIIDIIDVDKLIAYSNVLLKFRDNFELIKESWSLFVDVVNDNTPTVSELLAYNLTLADLKMVKSALQLDGSGKQTLSDVLLIDMLSCCNSDESGNINNFNFSKNSKGLFIDIKDFAFILGSLGEFD